MPGMRKGEPALRLAVLLALAALVLPAALLPVAEAARVTSSPTLPVPLLGTSTVWTGKDVYVFGGRSNTSYQASIVKYDPATGTAATTTSLLPSGRQSTSAVWDGRDRPSVGCPKGCAYIFGGAELVQYNHPTYGQIAVPNAVRDIVRFNPQTGEVTKLAEALPDGVWGTSAVWDPSENAAYVFGGFAFHFATNHFERKDWIVKYKPDADGVTESKVVNLAAGASPKRLPTPVQDAAVAVHAGKAYIFGGLVDQAAPSDAIVTFNLATEQVATLPERLPHGVHFAPAAAVADSIYIFGGRVANASGTGSILRFHAASNGPAEIFELPLPSVRYAISAATDGNTVWLIGGRDTKSNVGGFRDVITFVPGTTEPTAPRDLRLAGCDAGGLRLAWTPPLYNGGAPLTGYTVYRIDADGISRNLTFLPATALAYTDGAAKPGGAYSYRVTSSNGAGESRAAAETAVTACLRAPSEPRAFEAYAGNGSAHLRWQPPADNGGATTVVYRIYRNNTVLKSSHAGTTFTDSTVKNDVAYTYAVAAVGGALASPLSATETVTPSSTLPDAPTGLRVDRVAEKDRFLLSWNASARATSYTVRWGTSLGDPDKSAVATGTTFTITGVTPGLRYYIDVQARNGSLKGPPSALQTAAYVTPPTEPGSLQAMPGPGYIRLQWTAPNSTGGADSVLYKIFRNETTGSVTAVGEAALWKGTAWVDRNVTGGESYVYRVVPYVVENAAPLFGRGAQTASVKAILAANQPPLAEVFVKPGVNVAKLVDVTFDASFSRDPDGLVRQYRFYFGDGSETGWVSSPTVTHRYTADGVYTASVEVKDDRGDASLRRASVQVTVGIVREEQPSDPGNGNPINGSNRPGGGGTTAEPTPRAGFLGLPGPGAVLVALGAAGVALALRRRR